MRNDEKITFDALVKSQGLDHLELPRAKGSLPRKKRGGAGRPPERNKREHGEQLLDESDGIVSDYSRRKRPSGISPTLVFRLKLHRKAYLDENELRRLGLFVISRDPNKTDIILPNTYVSWCDDLTSRFDEWWNAPHLDGIDNHGASFWLRKKRTKPGMKMVRRFMFLELCTPQRNQRLSRVCSKQFKILLHLANLNGMAKRSNGIVFEESKSTSTRECKYGKSIRVGRIHILGQGIIHARRIRGIYKKKNKYEYAARRIPLWPD